MFLLLTLTLAAVPTTPAELAAMTEADRRARLSQLSREEVEQVLRDTPPDALLKLSATAINALGTYEYTMVKEERINGTVKPAQTILVTIQEAPQAIRLEYLKGPGAGRKVIFNAAVKAKAFKVREAGFLSFAPMRLDVNSPLAKGDSNHTVPEAGLGALVRRLQGEQARAAGKLTVTHEGWRDDGQFCSLYVSGAKTEHASTRICTDPKLGVPMRVEGFDPQGQLLERYVFSGLKPVRADSKTFDPDQGL